MLTYLRQTTSLNNLRSKRSSGQIATLLILAMVVVLVMILVTVNLGQLSLTATTLSNAADSASLLLASQLATKSRVFWETLGGTTRKETTEGWGTWDWVELVVMVVIAVVMTLLCNICSHGFWALVVSATLAAANKLYQFSVAQDMRAEAFTAIAKSLSGLPERWGIREGVVFLALTQTVADPRKMADTNDSDGNGNTTEKVPVFQDWYYRRVIALKEVLSPLAGEINNFINGPLTSFSDFATKQYTQYQVPFETWDDGGYTTVYTTATGPFYTAPESGGQDGNVIELVKAIEIPVPDIVSVLQVFAGLATSLKAQNYSDRLLESWESWIKWFYNDDVDTDYYDTLKTNLVADLDNLKAAIESKRTQLAQCNYQWQSCITDYDGLPQCTSCTPPICPEYAYKTESTNSPCQDGSFGTIDTDLDDEFAAAQASIDALLVGIEGFRNSILTFYNYMNDLLASISMSTSGGLNPVTYSWPDALCADDSDCHSISVDVSHFELAWIESGDECTERSLGMMGLIGGGMCTERKYWLELKDYTDNGDNTRVKITRADQPDAAKTGVGALGSFNPFGKGEITKVSKAAYSYNYVNIVGKE